MVTLVNDDLPILSNYVVHLMFVRQTLDHGDIDQSCQFSLSTTYLTNRLGITSKENADL